MKLLKRMFFTKKKVFFKQKNETFVTKTTRFFTKNAFSECEKLTEKFSDSKLKDLGRWYCDFGSQGFLVLFLYIYSPQLIILVEKNYTKKNKKTKISRITLGIFLPQLNVDLCLNHSMNPLFQNYDVCSLLLIFLWFWVSFLVCLNGEKGVVHK